MSKQPVNTAEISFRNLNSGILSTLIDPRTGAKHLAPPSITEIIPTQSRDGSDRFMRYGYDVRFDGKRVNVTDECIDLDTAERDLRNYLALQEQPIDITDPINWANFVDERGYVHYRTAFGTLGFPVKAPFNGDCGWWSPKGAQEPVHFKTDDFHVRMSLDGDTTIIFRPNHEAL